MNPIQASRSLRLTTSHLRLALALLSPFGALTMHAQTTLNDAQVIADLNKIAGDSTPEFPGTVGSPLFYVIGATGAYDTNLGEGLELLLYDYTTFTVQNGSAVEYSSGGLKATFSAPRIHEGKRLEVAAETPLPLRRNLPSLPFVNTRWLRPSCDLNLLPSRSGARKIAVDSRSQPPPRAHMEFPRFLWIDSGARPGAAR
jgi:hypothetical protein